MQISYEMVSNAHVRQLTVSLWRNDKIVVNVRFFQRCSHENNSNIKITFNLYWNHYTEFRSWLRKNTGFCFLHFGSTDLIVIKFAISGGSLFCMEEDDNRFEPMCCHYLSGSPCNDILLGAEECTSPFGSYELSMPIDDTIPCALNSSLITHKNCREFDVSFSALIYELNIRK